MTVVPQHKHYVFVLNLTVNERLQNLAGLMVSRPDSNM